MKHLCAVTSLKRGDVVDICSELRQGVILGTANNEYIVSTEKETRDIGGVYWPIRERRIELGLDISKEWLTSTIKIILDWLGL